jgi:tetratricopeptide (TPR) repeat protein
MKSKSLLLFLIMLGAVLQGHSQSYISRLWNTKKYAEIIEYSPKGQSLSGQDNVFIGRAYMSLETHQPADALRHYDLAISKRWQREDLYFFRSEANYELGRLDAALADLEVCLQMRPNYQKYLLFKAAIAYEKGDRDLAYDTYFTLCELYDKQLPFYMMAVISIERGNHYKAQQQVDANMLRFERGKEFWTFTAEQQVELEWRIFKDYEKALKAQDALLSHHGGNAQYLINRMVLLRLQGLDSAANIAENDFQDRYNNNQLPLDFYKKGNFKVAEFNRTNGVVEDFRYFRPRLYNNTKYARYYISDGGQVVGKHWAGLTRMPKDTPQKQDSDESSGFA